MLLLFMRLATCQEVNYFLAWTAVPRRCLQDACWAFQREPLYSAGLSVGPIDLGRFRIHGHAVGPGDAEQQLSAQQAQYFSPFSKCLTCSCPVH